MVRIYVEAYDKDGLQILGNLDGQRSWQGTDHKRTAWYKELKNPTRKYPRVMQWKIVSGDPLRCLTTLETIANPNHPDWY